MKIRFMCLASGSSGNCFYLGTEHYGILIDAGISLRTIRKTLKDIGVDMSTLRGVFVTHDHADHIKAVGNIGEKFNIPIYATQLVHKGIRKSYCVTQELSAINIRYIEKDKTIDLEDFHITAFEVPHDGTDNVGYHIEIDGKVFCFLTDLGEITPTVQEHVEQANYLIIEANYDRDMLMSGKYPMHLKQRIYGDHGHLCNEATGDFLANHFPKDLRYIWLCHLSKDNNQPNIAYHTVKQKLEEKGIIVDKDVQLFALQRTTPSKQFIFE